MRRKGIEPIVLDFGDDGNVVGIDIQHASEVVDLPELNVKTPALGLVGQRS